MVNEKGEMTEEEFAKWERGVTLLDGKFEKVDRWEDALYGLDSEDRNLQTGILYTIGYKRVMEPMLSFDGILKLAELIKEKRKCSGKTSLLQ